MQIQQPTADPLPWITNVMRKKGVFVSKVMREPYGDWFRDEENPDEYGRPVWRQPYREIHTMAPTAASGLLTVLTQAVSALHDDAKAYTVVLSAATATAGTMLEKKVVQVGSKPMNDADLTEGQKASVMAGLALHEVGHIRYARQYSAAVTRLFGADNVTGAIRTLSNLAADLHDERKVCAVFPGLAPAVAVTLWWVGNKGALDGREVDKMLTRSAAERVNAAIVATRYPWVVTWDSPTATDWFQWWDEWATRAAQAERPKDHALIVQEAIEKIREVAIEEPPTDGPGPVCGPVGPKPPTEQPQQPRDDERPTGPGGDEPQEDEDPDDETQPGGDGDDDEDPEDGEGEDGPDDDGGSNPGDDEEPPVNDGPTGKGNGPDPDDDGPQGYDDDEDGEDPDDDGEEARKAPRGDGKANESGKGSMAEDGDGEPYSGDENAKMDDPCVKDAADAGHTDEVLQQSVEKITRGTREGMRRRHYQHASSATAGYGGRTVVSIPRKGKRFVWDV